MPRFRLPLLLLAIAASVALAHNATQKTKDVLLNRQWTTTAAPGKEDCKEIAQRIEKEGFKLSLDPLFTFSLQSGTEGSDRAALHHHKRSMIVAHQKGTIEHAKAIVRYWGSISNTTDTAFLGDMATRLANAMIRHRCPHFNHNFSGTVEWALCSCRHGLLPGDEWRGGEGQATAYHNRHARHPSIDSGDEDYQQRAVQVLACNRNYASLFIQFMAGRGSRSMRVLRERPLDRPDLTTYYMATKVAEKIGETAMERTCLAHRATGGIKTDLWPAHRLFPLLEVLRDALNNMGDYDEEAWIDRFSAAVDSETEKRKASYRGF